MCLPPILPVVPVPAVVALLLCTALCSAQLTCDNFAVSCGDGGILFYPIAASDCQCVFGAFGFRDVPAPAAISRVYTTHPLSRFPHSAVQEICGLSALLTHN